MERRARFRIGLLFGFIVLLVALFTLRIYKLQAAQTEQTIQEANSLTFQTRVDAARGQILDRNGTVLVTNRASYDLVMINFVFFNGPNPNGDLVTLPMMLGFVCIFIAVVCSETKFSFCRYKR